MARERVPLFLDEDRVVDALARLQCFEQGTLCLWEYSGYPQATTLVARTTTGDAWWLDFHWTHYLDLFPHMTGVHFRMATSRENELVLCRLAGRGMVATCGPAEGEPHLGWYPIYGHLVIEALEGRGEIWAGLCHLSPAEEDDLSAPPLTGRPGRGSRWCTPTRSEGGP
ncbi:MAG: hypothetical protein FJX77_14610 [Armatimonadetes bacterium]|nr:hypothetical protein [Armatimonadota bacterium]